MKGWAGGKEQQDPAFMAPNRVGDVPDNQLDHTLANNVYTSSSYLELVRRDKSSIPCVSQEKFLAVGVPEKRVDLVLLGSSHFMIPSCCNTPAYSHRQTSSLHPQNFQIGWVAPAEYSRERALPYHAATKHSNSYAHTHTPPSILVFLTVG